MNLGNEDSATCVRVAWFESFTSNRQFRTVQLVFGTQAKFRSSGSLQHPCLPRDRGLGLQHSA